MIASEVKRTANYFKKLAFEAARLVFNTNSVDNWSWYLIQKTMMFKTIIISLSLWTNDCGV